jgi:hypothetical protein
MSALREKLARAIYEAAPPEDEPVSYDDADSLFRHISGLEADAVLATLTTEARDGNLPSELLSAVDEGREVAAARRLAKGDA